MRGVSCLSRAVLVAVLAAPLTAHALVPPPPGDPQAPPELFRFAPPPASLACGQGSIRLVEGATLPPKAWRPYVPPVAPAGVTLYVPPPPPTREVYAFSVDGDGRVFDLKRAPTANGDIPWPVEEQAAIIASWRFAAGQPAQDCRLDLAPVRTPLAQASPAALFEAMAAEPRNPPQLLRKAVAAGGDCGGASRRRPQVIVYPDTRPFDDMSVDPAWAGLTFDIDAAGATRNVRVVARHGAPGFAEAAAGAIARGRYFPGPPRTRCYVAFKAMPKATDVPKREAPPPADDEACKITREQLNLPEDKFFPPAYAKQRVGGRALLRFDVAPWGQVGAIEVLESQPTAAFGEAARRLLASARPNASPAGHHGCVIPIAYAIPEASDTMD